MPFWKADMQRGLLICIGWLFPALLFAAVDPLTSSREPLSLLYSDRVLFAADGEPQVTMGLMSGREEILLRSAKPLIVTGANGKSQKVTLKPHEVLRIRRLSGHAADLRWRLVAGRFAPQNRAGLEAAAAEWTSLGYHPTPWRLGAPLAFKGRLIDNTRYALVIGEFADEQEAQARQQSLVAQTGRDVQVEAELQKLPGGVFELSWGKRKRLKISDLAFIKSADASPVTVPNCVFGQGFAGEGQADLDFSGTLYVTFDHTGKLVLGHVLGLEELLRGTVPSEIFTSAPKEALKAQSIAARGQLLAKLGTRHLADPYRLCATQHCQVYKGKNAHQAATDHAVDETRGQFLVNGEGLVDTVFSALSGGFTENNDSVWGDPPDANLRGKLDGPPDARFAGGVTENTLDAFLDSPPSCYSAHTGYNQEKQRWTRSYSGERLTELVNAQKPLGRVSGLRILKRGVSGRIVSLEITGENGKVTLNRELEVRRYLGGLPSSLIRLAILRAADGSIARVEIKGAGFGHGVGLCQTGAIGRAQAGQSAEQILSHYYGPAAKLETLY